MQNFSSDLQLAIKAAKAAGEVIKAEYGKVQTIEDKEDGAKGIVTNVDKESEEAILKILQSKSNYAIFSEETGNIEGSNELWVIDPIDGTTNFSRNVPLFCLSIGLIRKNKIELGVIYNPVLDELYFAEKGKGAFLNEKRIYISTQQTLKGSVMFINNGYALEDKEKYVEVSKRLIPYSSLRKFGSTAFELCYVAKGSADAFISSGDELYDYAAGLIIVEEAGGKVTDWKGKGWNNTNSFILASNGKIHQELLQKIQNLQS